MVERILANSDRNAESQPSDWLAAARLSSSIWIVCKKRSDTRPGWDNKVLDEMRGNITRQLRDFWDAGIRGPDFVWAATGPALEAFSKYPVVKKANAPGEQMSVSEFLRQVRRMVVDFVVGRVLIQDGARTARRMGRRLRPALTTSPPTTCSTATTSGWGKLRSAAASSTRCPATSRIPPW